MPCARSCVKKLSQHKQRQSQALAERNFGPKSKACGALRLPQRQCASISLVSSRISIRTRITKT